MTARFGRLRPNVDGAKQVLDNAPGMKKIPRNNNSKKCGGSMKIATIVGHLGGRCKGDSTEQHTVDALLKFASRR